MNYSDDYFLSENPTPQNPQSVLMVVAISLLSLAISTFIALDYGLAYETANTVAEISHKTLKAPDRPGQTPFLLAIRLDGEIYHVRVSVDYYRQVEKGTMVLVAERRGRFTNTLYKSWLFDTGIPLQQAFNTPKKPTESVKDVGTERLTSYYLFVPRKPSYPALNGRVTITGNPQLKPLHS